LNLKSAIAGETHEYTDMYPGFARTAREEGFTDIAEWFEARPTVTNLQYILVLTPPPFLIHQTLAKAEKSHAGKFNRVLQEVTTAANK